MSADQALLLNTICEVGATVIAFVVCLLGWLRGGPAAKSAALVFGIGWMGWVFVTLTAPALNDQLLPALLWDIWVALAFLYLAIRYNNLWIGGAMIAQGVQLGLRSLDVFLQEPRPSHVHFTLAASVNVLNFVMMAAIVGAAYAERRRPQAIITDPEAI